MLLVIQNRHRAAELYDDELLADTDYSHPGIRFETDPDAATEWPVAEVSDDELAERFIERYPSIIPLSEATEAPADEDIPDEVDAQTEAEAQAEAQADDEPEDEPAPAPAQEADDEAEAATEPEPEPEDESEQEPEPEPDNAEVPATSAEDDVDAEDEDEDEDAAGTLSGGPQPPDGG